MKKIPLTRGKFAIVDDEDYPILSRHKWQCSKDSYAVHSTFGRGKSPYQMQEWVISKKPYNKIMFINRNPLDCRKCNLVEVARGNPTHYSYKKKGKYTSNYKGVCYFKRDKVWIMQIHCDGKYIRKHCKTELEACILYNKKAKELYGELAFQNKIKKND